MKKLFFCLVVVLSVTCSAQTGVALASKQTTQIVAADTANARLNRIISKLGAAGSVTVSIARQYTLSPSSSSVTSSGTVTAGAASVMFTASSDFVGTIDGIALNANETITYSAANNSVLSQIVYAISAGSLRIRKLQ